MISFVVVTYRSADIIAHCLKQILDIDRVEIIVVDNASDDDTVSIAEALAVRVHRLDANVGFAKASNFGASLATGDLLCFLNPDCDIDSHVCDLARAALLEDRSAVAVPDFQIGKHVVFGRQHGYTRLKLIADAMESSGWPRVTTKLLKRWKGYDDGSWHWPLGTCLFIPKALFLTLGGFDERYFLYMEDVEFGHLLCQRGGRILQLPHVLAHGGGASTAVSRRQRCRLLTAARVLYARRHYGAPFALLLRFIARS